MIAARQANTGAPVVYHLNDTHTRKIIKTIFTFLARRWVDAFFPACERSKDYYLKNTPLADKPSFILPAPVDTAVFNPKLVEADARIDAFPGLKIVTVCNVHRGKGLDEMIDLCATLRTAFSGEALSFCVVGPVNKRHAAYLKEVKDTVREKQLDNFHFVGGTSNVPAALKAADIYLCVSHFESSPMAVWEAMSMGLPIVSTDVGDVKIFLEDGNCGFCVPVGDIGGMADKISTLIKDQNMRSKMGLNARKFAVQNLDLKICAQRHAQFYRQILHNKRAMK
jgi:glycosyltransferase involved in cell wall biosynthesis